MPVLARALLRLLSPMALRLACRIVRPAASSALRSARRPALRNALRPYSTQPNVFELFGTKVFQKLGANPAVLRDFQEATMRIGKKANPNLDPNFRPSPTTMFKVMMDPEVRADMVKIKDAMDKCGITPEDLQEFQKVIQKMAGAQGFGGGAGGAGDPMSAMLGLLGGGMPASPTPVEPAVQPNVRTEAPKPTVRLSGHKRFLPSQESPRDPQEAEIIEGEIVGEEKPAQERSGLFGRMKNVFGAKK